MIISTIDYVSAYFKYKIPIPIIGKLINKALKQLKLELQANTSLVETDLDSGNYRYLGLVLIDQECMNMSNTQPFIAPAYLRLLIILANATPVVAL